MRKSLYILGQVDDHDVEWMIAFGRRRAVHPGEVLIRQGESVQDLYLILRGRVIVRNEQLGAQELARLGAGEIVGEMSFVDAAPAMATVTVETEGQVLALAHEVLKRKLKDDTAFAAHFYRAIAVFLSDRLRATVRRMGEGTPVPVLDGDALTEDELDPAVLDTLHLAGRRFSRIVERLGTE